MATQEQEIEIDEILRWFHNGHLPVGTVQEVSQLCAQLALTLAEGLHYSDQLKQGLYDLLRAKDCFVRAAIAQTEQSRPIRTNNEGEESRNA